MACSIRIAVSISVLALSLSAEALESKAAATPVATPAATPAAPAPIVGANIKPAKIVMHVDRKDLHFDGQITGQQFSAGEVADVTTKKIQGIGLEGIVENSALWLLGFRDHDVLVSVNGHPMKAVSDLKLIETSLKVAKFHDYKVLRSNEPTEWRVEFIEVGKVVAEEPAAKPVVPERVTTLKKEMLKKLDAEPAATRLSPEFKEGGTIRCFRVVNVTAKSAFKRAGLVSGDCIFALNGKKFTSPAATLDMFDQMRAQGAPMTFEIERRGEKKAFRVEFE